MPLHVTTDHDAILAALDRQLAIDPVRATVLGTIRAVLRPGAWAAIAGELLAVRSGTDHPVLVAGPWQAGAATHDELTGLLRELPGLRGISGSVPVVDPLAAALADGAPADRSARRMGQRLFRCDQLVAPAEVPGRAAIAGAAGDGGVETVRAWFADFMAEAGVEFGNARESADRAIAENGAWLWFDNAGDPVSLAARRPVLAGSGRIGPVYTPPDSRGRGYGSAVTAAATRAVRDDGGVPVLFTDLANPTSNKIYQQLGYRAVEDRAVWSFR
jgi:GNAT superfamily N-acetyltransferase